MPKIIRLVSGVNRVAKPQVWSLQKFYERRNHILIRRSAGGLGDIIMHRMIFEDFKLVCPEIRITFACPKIYHSAVKDHPFIDEVIDHMEVNQNDFIVRYDTTTSCGARESSTAPLSSMHRSDIWAEDSCGIKLTRHNIHLTLTNDEIDEAKSQVNAINSDKKPTVLIAPLSAISSKNMDESQWSIVIKSLHEMGYFVYGLHSYAILNFDAPQLHGKNTRNFMGLINAADYVVTVDTSTFHVAGALGKPQVGVFSWTDGKVYGKYYKNWELVQRHRDNGNWDCGPCYTWTRCHKCQSQTRKPCITEITGEEIVEGFKRLTSRVNSVCQES